MLLPLLLASLALVQDPASLSGRLVDGDGGPRVDVLVEANLFGHPPWRTRSDAQGRFVFTLPDPIPVGGVLEASHPGCAPVWRLIDLERVARERGMSLGDLVLDAPGNLIVRVVDGAGEVQLDVPVRLRPLGDSMAWALTPGTLPSVETGEVRFEDVPAGAYFLDCGLRDLTERVQVEVDPGVETFVQLDLTQMRGDGALLWLDAGRFPLELESRHLRVSTALGTPVPAQVRGGPEFDLRIPAGIYELDLDHPDFRLRAPVPVQRGDVLRLQLEPRAELALTLAPPPGSPAPTGFGLLAVGPRHPSLVIELAPPGGPVPRGPITRRLPPGRWLVRVDTDAYPSRWVSLDLVPDVRRELEVALHPGRPIVARLRAGPGCAPVAGARASLRRGPAWRDAPWSDLGAPDVDGRLELGSLQPEPYTLRLTWSPWLAMHLKLDDPLGDLISSTPPAGWIEGRVLMPAGLDPERVELGIAEHPITLEAAGAFRCGPLPPGPAEVWISLDRSTWERAATAHVTTGGIARPTLELDPRAIRHPSLRLRVEGEPHAAATVHLVPRDGGPARRCTTDTQGWVKLMGFFPGTYDLAVLSPQGWSTPLATPVEMQAGSLRGWRVDIALIERVVRLLDATGAPLRRRTFFHHTGRNAWAATGRARSDDAGECRLTLPAGAVRFTLGAPDHGASPSLAWCAGQGPMVLNFKRDD